MERDFLGAIGKEQQQQRPAEEEGRKESAYFGGGGTPAMDWSFASRAGAAPALMSFRSAAREEPRELPFPQFSAFDGVKKQQTSHVLTPQRSFGADSHVSPQYAAVHGAHRGQQPPQHVLNGARVIPVSSPFNPNNPIFRVQSSPNLPNVIAGGGAFKQPPFAVNNAVAGSTVGVYGTRDMPKAKTEQLTIFYAGSVNVFNNVSPEKAQELMFLASKGSLPSASSTVARKPEAPIFAPAKVAVPEVLPVQQMLLQKPQHVLPPASGISKPISIVSQAASLPRSASSSSSDSTVPKSSGPLVAPPTSQPPLTQPAILATTTAAAIMPRGVGTVRLRRQGQGANAGCVCMTTPSCRCACASSPQRILPLPTSFVYSLQSAIGLTSSGSVTSLHHSTRQESAVPQARKASLARFLEKRKERVTTASPYPSAKSPLESSDTIGSANDNSKSSCTDIALSSNHDESRCLGQPRNISFSGESPITKLQI